MTEVLPLFSTPLYISQDEVLDAPEVEYNSIVGSKIFKT